MKKLTKTKSLDVAILIILALGLAGPTVTSEVGCHFPHTTIPDLNLAKAAAIPKSPMMPDPSTLSKNPGKHPAFPRVPRTTMTVFSKEFAI